MTERQRKEHKIGNQARKVALLRAGRNDAIQDGRWTGKVHAGIERQVKARAEEIGRTIKERMFGPSPAAASEPPR